MVADVISRTACVHPRGPDDQLSLVKLLSVASKKTFYRFGQHTKVANLRGPLPHHAACWRSSSMSWDVARKQVRNLETRLDAALNRYSRVAGDLSKVSSSSNWPSQSDDEGRKLPVDVDEGQKLETELEQMLTEVSSTTEVSFSFSLITYLSCCLARQRCRATGICP